MANQRVYVSYDPTEDSACREELLSWAEGSGWEFLFPEPATGAPDEDIESNRDARVTLIGDTRYTLVLVGGNANQRHPLHARIGGRNWMNWEIEESIRGRNRVAAVKLDWSNTSPDALAGTHASWARGFRKEALFDALENA